MDTLKPVSRTTLSEQVAVQLASELAANRWKPGEKLPSEAELCRVFNVGRSTLREALKSLAFIGLIRMRAGGGSYAAERPSSYLNEPWFKKGMLTTEKDLTDLSEARIVLEGELASMCADRATDQDFENLERIMQEMSTAIERDDAPHFWQFDLEFHLAIAAASGNQVLSEMLKHIREALRELITKSLLLPAGRELAYGHHREILDAIKLRNPSKARNAMRHHLQAFRRGYKVLFRTPLGQKELQQATEAVQVE